MNFLILSTYFKYSAMHSLWGDAGTLMKLTWCEQMMDQKWNFPRRVTPVVGGLCVLIILQAMPAGISWSWWDHSSWSGCKLETRQRATSSLLFFFFFFFSCHCSLPIVSSSFAFFSCYHSFHGCAAVIWPNFMRLIKQHWKLLNLRIQMSIFE